MHIKFLVWGGGGRGFSGGGGGESANFTSGQNRFWSVNWTSVIFACSKILQTLWSQKLSLKIQGGLTSAIFYLICCWNSKLAGAKKHPKTQHTRKRRHPTVPRICVFGCVAFSGVLWRPLREQRAPENATHPKTQILETVDYLRFRVCCVFGC